MKLLINFCFQKLKNEWKRKEGGHKVREGMKLHVSVTQADFLTDQHEHLGWDKQQNDLVMWQFADKQSVCVCVGARTCFFFMNILCESDIRSGNATVSNFLVGVQTARLMQQLWLLFGFPSPPSFFPPPPPPPFLLSPVWSVSADTPVSYIFWKKCELDTKFPLN